MHLDPVTAMGCLVVMQLALVIVSTMNNFSPTTKRLLVQTILMVTVFTGLVIFMIEFAWPMMHRH
jgi:hypothetical protein